MQPDSTGSSAVNDDARKQAFKTASEMLGAKLTGFVREGETLDATYHLSFESGWCFMGTVDKLFDLNEARCRIYSAVGVVLEVVDDAEWQHIIRALTAFRIDISKSDLPSLGR